MSLAIVVHFLCAQHVSNINISIIRSLRLFCWITTLVVLWYSGIVVTVLQAEASTWNTDTTPNQPHRNSNTHRTKNNTTNVAVQQNSRKILMMDILMSETCWTHKKWNKIARVVLQPATRIPLQPNHTETPTHIEPRTIQPMWQFNRIVARSWWWIY